MVQLQGIKASAVWEAYPGEGERETETETETETERQTDRQRQAGRQTDRHRQTDRNTDRQTDRQIEIETHRDRHRERQRQTDTDRELHNAETISGKYALERSREGETEVVAGVVGVVGRGVFGHCTEHTVLARTMPGGHNCGQQCAWRVNSWRWR